MKNYVKQSGNPCKDGLYDTNDGKHLFYQGDWYWFIDYRFEWKKSSKSTMPEYYYEELIED